MYLNYNNKKRNKQQNVLRSAVAKLTKGAIHVGLPLVEDKSKLKTISTGSDVINAYSELKNYVSATHGICRPVLIGN